MSSLAANILALAKEWHSGVLLDEANGTHSQPGQLRHKAVISLCTTANAGRTQKRHCAGVDRRQDGACYGSISGRRAKDWSW